MVAVKARMTGGWLSGGAVRLTRVQPGQMQLRRPPQSWAVAGARRAISFFKERVKPKALADLAAAASSGTAHPVPGQHGGSEQQGPAQVNAAAPGDGVAHVLDLRRVLAVFGHPTHRQRPQGPAAPTDRVH